MIASSGLVCAFLHATDYTGGVVPWKGYMRQEVFE